MKLVSDIIELITDDSTEPVFLKHHDSEKNKDSHFCKYLNFQCGASSFMDALNRVEAMIKEHKAADYHLPIIRKTRLSLLAKELPKIQYNDDKKEKYQSHELKWAYDNGGSAKGSFTVNIGSYGRDLKEALEHFKGVKQSLIDALESINLEDVNEVDKS